VYPLGPLHITLLLRAAGSNHIKDIPPRYHILGRGLLHHFAREGGTVREGRYWTLLLKEWVKSFLSLSLLASVKTNHLRG